MMITLDFDSVLFYSTGHAKGDKFVTTPKLVTSLNHKNMTISTIAASEGVTVCSASNGDIYLLQNYICRKIVNK